MRTKKQNVEYVFRCLSNPLVKLSVVAKHCDLEPWRVYALSRDIEKVVKLDAAELAKFCSYFHSYVRSGFGYGKL